MAVTDIEQVIIAELRAGPPGFRDIPLDSSSAVGRYFDPTHAETARDARQALWNLIRTTRVLIHPHSRWLRDEVMKAGLLVAPVEIPPRVDALLRDGLASVKRVVRLRLRQGVTR